MALAGLKNCYNVPELTPLSDHFQAKNKAIRRVQQALYSNILWREGHSDLLKSFILHQCPENEHTTSVGIHSLFLLLFLLDRSLKCYTSTHDCNQDSVYHGLI